MLARRTDRLANAVRLLVAMGGFTASPSPKSGLDVYDAIRRIAAQPPPSLEAQARSLTDAAREVFAGFRDAPPNADALYAQMVEAGLLTPAEIVSAGMDARSVTAAMVAKLTDPAHLVGAMPHLFTAITVPTFEPLLASKDYAADLTPAFMADLLQGVHWLEGAIENVAEKLDNLEAQSRDTLEAIALRFGEPEPERLSLPGLRSFLIEKARDYRRLLVQDDAIDERTLGLGNLKAAAKDAIARADLAEVERLLSRVDEVETEIAAETKLLRADNALLRGRVEEAYRLLSAAADSFASVDPLEPAWRRCSYMKRLDKHGRRYGSSGYAFGTRMVEEALSSFVPPDDPELYFSLTNNLALSWKEQAKLTRDRDLLDRAATLLRAAFSVAGDNSIMYARMLQNYGDTLTDLSGFSGRATARRLINEAETHLTGAKDIFRENNDTEREGRVWNEIGRLQSIKGRRRIGGISTEHFADAAASYRTAIIGLKTDPTRANETRENLTTALYLHATSCSGAARSDLLNECIREGEAAVASYRDFGQPHGIARTQHILGLAHEALADERRLGERRAELERAAACLAATIGLYDPENIPHDSKTAHESLERVCAKLADMT